MKSWRPALRPQGPLLSRPPQPSRGVQVVKINGVKMGADLSFTGPFAVAGDAKRWGAYERIQQADRLKVVTLTALKPHIQKFGWVLPGEFEDCPLGAFVYEYKDQKDSRYVKMEVWVRSPSALGPPQTPWAT